MDNSEIKKSSKINQIIMIILFALFIFILTGYSIYSYLKIDELSADIKELNLTINDLQNSEDLIDNNESVEEFIDIEEFVKENEILDLTDGEEYGDMQRIYLTFDDGPGKYTNDLLDILNDYGVKATFFVTYQPGHEEEYLRIVNEGHTLAIHSYTHSYKKVYKDLNGFSDDVDKMYDYLYELTGIEPTIYRFPGGSSNTIYKGDKNTLFDFLNEKNLVYYDWNCESNDASTKTLTSNQIAKNVIKSIGNKKEAIVLMHDTTAKKTTIDAVPAILDYYMENDNVVFLPITDSTEPIQHIKKK